MIQLQLTEKDARVLHATGSAEWKTVLEASAPANFFKQSILDRVQSVESLFKERGLDYELYKSQTIGFSRHTIAYDILKSLCEVLNEGWIPDYNDHDQEKWWLWYYLNEPGFRLDVAYCDYTNTYAGARLAVKRKEIALHIDQYFKHVVLDFMTY